jgi:osmotically inducible protein OsmC
VIAMPATRSATVTWTGSLAEGSGTVSAGSSDLFTDLPVSWASRTEAPDGRTSPEELLAAAHASCFSMALAHALAQAGNAPESLSTSATVTFVPGTGITKSVLDVEGVVPGLSEEEFHTAADGAKQNCPVSKALAGNVDLELHARLKS